MYHHLCQKEGKKQYSYVWNSSKTRAPSQVIRQAGLQLPKWRGDQGTSHTERKWQLMGIRNRAVSTGQ